MDKSQPSFQVIHSRIVCIVKNPYQILFDIEKKLMVAREEEVRANGWKKVGGAGFHLWSD